MRKITIITYFLKEGEEVWNIFLDLQLYRASHTIRSIPLPPTSVSFLFVIDYGVVNHYEQETGRIIPYSCNKLLS